MSAFIVTAACMRRVVHALCSRDRYGAIIRRFADIDTSGADAPRDIGRKLFAMNVAAVRVRYPDDALGADATLAETFDCDLPSPMEMDTEELAAAVKAIQCLQYQCSEGDIPETPLYVELAAATGLVAEAVVERLPAWKAAKWGA